MMGIPAPLYKGVAGAADPRATAKTTQMRWDRDRIARAKPTLQVVSATPVQRYGPDKIS
jgi:hypothetical protein